MPLTRRRFLLASLPAAMLLSACRGKRPPTSTTDGDELSARINRAQKKAADYLASKQSPDGTWRSTVYGPFKFGDALTPLCLNAYFANPDLALSTASPPDEVCRKAGDYLASFAESGRIEEPKFGFEFTTYTAALSVVALGSGYFPALTKARDAWLAYLKERQLTEALGWTPDDRAFGGWGYCRVLPRKPKGNELIVPLLESNLSATTFALTALQSTGILESDPAHQKAAVFVKRCQNWAATKDTRDPSYDDGGFYFIYDDPVRNKAGLAGRDRFDRERFHSYGSATADGLRCLQMCGLAGSDSFKAAEAWMRRHFHWAKHPGRYDEKREMDREAVYYYYAASLARSHLEPWTARVDGKEKSWKKALIDELLARQLPDGSWANRAHAVREDDPLNATSSAMLALAHLR